MVDTCSVCGKKIGRLEGLQLRVVNRTFKKAEKKFNINLNSANYADKCKACVLTAADNRLNQLTMELQIDAEKAGMSVKDYAGAKIREIRKFIEGEAATEARRAQVGYKSKY